MSCIDVNAKV